MTAHRTFAALALIGGMVGLSACGSGDATSAGGPTASTAVLARVVTAGGFTTRADQFSIVPEVVIYVDGRVISPALGDQPDHASRPLLPPLQVRRLDAEGLRRMREAIVGSGLLTGDEVDYGAPNITDTPTTTVSLSVDGRTASHAANALREVRRFGVTGLTKAQLEARDNLSRLIHDLRSAGTVAGPEHIGPAETYVPQRFMLESYATLERAATPVTWPLASADISRTETCVDVDADAAVTLREGLSSASVSTVFAHGDDRYQVAVRPVLPGEPGCPEEAAE